MKPMIAAILLLLPLLAHAQDDSRTLQTSGQIRARGEVDDRDFNEDTDASDQSLLRARLNLKAQLSDRRWILTPIPRPPSCSNRRPFKSTCSPT